MAPIAENAAMPSKQGVYDCVVSKMKPIDGCASVAPIFMQVAVIPNPKLAKLVPKISGGKADTIGGVIAAATPRARIEATNVRLEANAEATRAKVIKR